MSAELPGGATPPEDASGAPAPQRIAVLDIGKTNVKVVLFDGASGTETWARTEPNTVRQDGPYPHFDETRIAAFVVDALADLVRLHGIDAMAVTAHGASGALVGPHSLAMPVLDYEFTGPDDLAEAYDRVRPPFTETFSPRLRGGLNLGAQLFWQARTFPDAFAGATAILTYPQYWAFWLTGIMATEPTSLGTHTDLWAPRERGLSSLVETMGWGAKMAPLRSAFDTLGPIRPALAARIGLDRPVPVACGIHDSNASLLPHIQTASAPLSVVSTGTWAILFALGGSLNHLDPARDTLANVDAYGRPVPSARFMGGREFDMLTARASGVPDEASIAKVLAEGIMALPTFVSGSGPFPERIGRWSHDPASLTPPERVAAASLYVALLSATCLDLLAAQGPTVIEGPFARNALFCDALAQQTGRQVLAAQGTTGTSAGAAHLLRPGGAPPVTEAHTGSTAPASLAAYAARWRMAATEPNAGQDEEIV